MLMFYVNLLVFVEVLTLSCPPMDSLNHTTLENATQNTKICDLVANKATATFSMLSGVSQKKVNSKMSASRTTFAFEFINIY